MAGRHVAPSNRKSWTIYGRWVDGVQETRITFDRAEVEKYRSSGYRVEQN